MQTGLLLILFGKIVLLEDEATVQRDADPRTMMSNPLYRTSSDTRLTSASYPDEDQLRKIVREELAAQLGTLSGTVTQENAVSVSRPRDEVEDQKQKELVAQQLSYHKSVGHISDSDMQKLQVEIARLDEAGRREMLGELSRAINSGQLDGRL